MPNEPAQAPCGICGSSLSSEHAILHHMICAYVGPAYDFDAAGDERRCPKCLRLLRSEDSSDWEVVGTSYRCMGCSDERLGTRV
ncbi:hypothetical protein [Bosea sp. BIWAKO-01]|uniref:TackOD1 domain-containing metal-binding protein n=1 Tax=Bosea sp. BIWAKO-01 TaxID=506668 RepID=UPI00159F1515